MSSDPNETLRMIAQHRETLDLLEEQMRAALPGPHPPGERTGLPGPWGVAVPSPPPPPPNPEPEPEPEADPVASYQEHIEGWRDFLVRPELSSAMMFVILPVIEELISSDQNDLYWSSRASDLVEDLKTWGKITVAERLALTELFSWVMGQLHAGEESVIPPGILANFQAVERAYQGLG